MASASTLVDVNAPLRLATVAGETAGRRITQQGEAFNAATGRALSGLAEYRGAIRRKQRGEALADVLMIAGLAAGGIAGAEGVFGANVGTAGGIAIGGQAGSLLSAGIAGEAPAPELAAIPTLAGNIRDQQAYADLEAAAGRNPLGDVPSLPRPAGLPAGAAPLPEPESPIRAAIRSYRPRKRPAPGGR